MGLDLVQCALVQSGETTKARVGDVGLASLGGLGLNDVHAALNYTEGALTVRHDVVVGAHERGQGQTHLQH